MMWTRLLPLGTAFVICGCEKLPELPIGGEKTTESVTETTEAASTQTPPEAPPPPKPTPEKLISDFKAKSTIQLTEADVLELAALDSGLDQVEELDLKGSRLSPAALDALSSFRNLKHLNLQSAYFGGGDLSGISKLTTLESLDLSRTATKNANLASISGLTGLKVLKLAQTAINDDGLTQLSSLTALEELDISATDIVGVGLAAFGKDGANAPLRILRASQSKLGTQGFRFINQFPLEELLASKSMVTDLSLAGLRGCNKLKVLDLSFNQITDDAAKWLVSSQVLEHVNLMRNPGISDGALRRLQTISTLKLLNLTKTSGSPKAIEGLKKRLPECQIMLDGQTL